MDFRFLLPVELHGFHEIAYPSLETKELPQTHALCDVKLKAIIAASRHELFVVEYPTPPDSSTGYLATQALQALLDKRSEATRDYGFIHNLCALITRITTRIIFGYWQFTKKIDAVQDFQATHCSTNRNSKSNRPMNMKRMY